MSRNLSVTMPPPGRLRHLFAKRRAGIVLPTVLVLSTVITMTVLVLSVGVSSDLRIAGNDLMGRRALAVAESGINHALAALDGTVASEQRLSAELGDAPTGALSTIGAAGTVTEDGVARGYRCATFAPGDGESAGDPSVLARGTYCVRADDNFDDNATADDPATDLDGIVVLRSRGEVGGAVRVLEALAGIATGPPGGIIVNGNLTIAGNAVVSGSQGRVHANGSLIVGGNPSITGGGTSSSAMSLQGTPVLEDVRLSSPALLQAYAESHGGRAPVPVPPVRPMAFGTSAMPLHEHIMNDANGFRLDADGNIYVGPGYAGPGGAGSAWSCSESLANCTGGRALTTAEKAALGLDGWVMQAVAGQLPAVRWVAASGNPVNGLYFVEGSVSIERNWGKGTACPCPWRATVVTLNSLAMSSTPRMSAYHQSVDPAGPGYVTRSSPARQWDLRNLLVVSGNDLGVNGTGEVIDFAGGFFAHQQLRIDGNPRIAGFLVGENGASTWPGDPAAQCGSGANLFCDPAVGHYLAGNPVIDYDGLGSSVYPARVQRYSWRDVR